MFYFSKSVLKYWLWNLIYLACTYPGVVCRANSYLEPRILPGLGSLIPMRGLSSNDPGTFEITGEMRERRGHI